jgi:hypothetical protein
MIFSFLLSLSLVTPSLCLSSTVPEWTLGEVKAECGRSSRCLVTVLGEVFDATSSHLLVAPEGSEGVSAPYASLCCAGETGRLLLSGCSAEVGLARSRCGSDPIRLEGLPPSAAGAAASWRAHFHSRLGEPIAHLLLDLDDGLNEDYRELAEKQCRAAGGWTRAAGCPLTSRERTAARLRLATFYSDAETMATLLSSPLPSSGPTPPPTLATTYRQGGIEAVRRTLAGDGDDLFDGEAAAAAPATAELTLHLRNVSPNPVEVLWVNGEDGSEHAVTSTLAAEGGGVDLTSYPGHSFAFRAADGTLVASYDIPPTATGSITFTVT